MQQNRICAILFTIIIYFLSFICGPHPLGIPFMPDQKRIRMQVQGLVQGVGFRPFVYRTAVSLGLKGHVLNTPEGLEAEVEGAPRQVSEFAWRLVKEAPRQARISKISVEDLAPRGDSEFRILSSLGEGDPTARISPDLCVCDDCLRELFDPRNRRYRYPFINCTNCGPRYTIIRGIPYDRAMTTMSAFNMCPECRSEYEDPLNRRFHAQPNACAVCGPRAWLVDNMGRPVNSEDPLRDAAEALKRGEIAAVKGIGGFHLACDARNGEAVARLRKRKGREEKPLAVMAPDLDALLGFAEPTAIETDLLLSPARPIVLLAKKVPFPLALSISPGNPRIGVMLPYSPLHAVLLHDFSVPLVMTSGNLSEEPIATDNQEAMTRLMGIADFFLLHDRDIFIRNDDSVYAVIHDIPRPVRRSRGYAPDPVVLNRSYPAVLAVGAELKNTVCLLRGDEAFMSQHVGDMENAETLRSFEKTMSHMQSVLRIQPDLIAHDLHPDYLSTKWALSRGKHCFGIQHHHAHIASCLAENGREERVIGLALDGTGYGTDGRIWGGEILVADTRSFTRAGHFSYRAMPGGEAAIREPWRMAVSHLYSVERGDSGSAQDFYRWIADMPIAAEAGEDRISTMVHLIRHRLNCPETSSLGRLFDTVACMAGLRCTAAYEGQAAVELEAAMGGTETQVHDMYRFEWSCPGNCIEIKPDAVLLAVRQDVLDRVSVRMISQKFHAALVRLFSECCAFLREKTGLSAVALSGGCFMNRFLSERLTSRLASEGFEVLTHTRVPANDGGLALGQAVIAANRS